MKVKVDKKNETEKQDCDSVTVGGATFRFRKSKDEFMAQCEKENHEDNYDQLRQMEIDQAEQRMNDHFENQLNNHWS